MLYSTVGTTKRFTTLCTVMFFDFRCCEQGALIQFFEFRVYIEIKAENHSMLKF